MNIISWVHKQYKSIVVEIFESTYLSFFKLIKIYEIDTGIVHYAPKNSLTFSVGSGENTRKYIIDRNKIKNNTMFVLRNCAEPLTFDYEKSVYYVDSKEFDVTYGNKLIKQMYASNQMNTIQYILYVVAGHALFTIAVHFGYIQ